MVAPDVTLATPLGWALWAIGMAVLLVSAIAAIVVLASGRRRL